MTVSFLLPTLVSLTAPTCAGKNFLLEQLVSKLGFGRIVGTTTRAPRDGEVEGVHYNFLSAQESKDIEARNGFAELLTYNGVRYGVTHDEMLSKLAPGKPAPIVILTPHGIELYEEFCRKHGYQLFKIYIETPESVRLNRLTTRTTNNILNELQGRARYVNQRSSDDESDIRQVIQRNLDVNNRRLKAILDEERQWSHTNRWDVSVSGTDAARALADVELAVKHRNSKIDIYQ